MKKTARRFLSMLLALSMVFGLLVFPAAATETEEPAAPVETVEAPAPAAETAEDEAPAAETTEEAAPASQKEAEEPVAIVKDSSFTYKLNTENIDVSDVGIGGVTVPEDAEVDEDNREIIAVSEELKNITVLNEDGESVALTEEQIQTILYLYSLYQQVMIDNANIYGVQTPFFLAFNDDKDGLGILGEMLVLAGTSVDAVRSGEYSYDTLVGMIQNFTYTYDLGAKYYANAILAAKDEALQAVENSGAQTEVQKLLVLDNWLAQNNTFDMPYIMNADSDGSGTIENDEKLMEAPNGPQTPEHYDDVYEIVYDDYTDQFTQMFHDQIFAGIEADLRQQFYENAIRNIVYQNAYDAGVKEAAQDEQVVAAAKEAYIAEQTEKEYEAEKQRVYDEVYDEAYAKYLEDADQGTENPDQGTENPDQGTENPDQGTENPDKGTENPDQGTENPDQGTENPDQGTENSDQGTENPDQGTENPDQGTENPDQGIENPDQENEKPDEGSENITVTDEENTSSVNELTPEEKADALAKADAEKAVKERDEEIRQTASEKAKAAYDALSDEEKLDLAKDIVESDEETVAQIEEAANAAADDFMTENADAIEEDAPGFVEATFGEEAAAQLAAACDDFIADAEENGVEVDPENAPGYKMTVEEITQSTMANEAIVDLDGDDVPETTANDAIPIYADQAAAGMTTGIINGWKGCHIGALGFGTSVCLGYAKAFTYLVQCMHPEVYCTTGNAADMNDSANWISADDLYEYDENGKLNLYGDYLVDTVRVTFDTEISMFGPDNTSNFGEVHFWNAVKVNNKWYYIDPCYVDVYVEVMSRDRVETDGNMNHLYFMFSHTSAANMYDGYTNTSYGDDGSGITSFYSNEATYQDYEDSWMSRINCTPYFEGGYAYYVYDSLDLLTILEDSKDESSFADMDTDALYKLVRHDLSKEDADDGDSDYFTLITFNMENDDGELEAWVYDPDAQETVKNDLLTELMNRHSTYSSIYPSVEITSVLYGGKLYFNLANCICSLDLNTYEVALVKEYNTVYGVRNNDVDFGGKAFTVTTEDQADFTVENHPIAALSLVDDELTVSIATNFAMISGKKVRTNPAIEVDGEFNGYGYEYEESNFNPNYNTFFNSDEGEQYGVEKEVNDNDEFMWSANFVDKLSMSHLAGDSHTYEAVTVAAFCGIDGFTENRCTTCGAIEAGSRVYDEGTAHEHHYVQFDEIYYTKNDAGSWNRGTCYVCAMCGYAVSEPSEPSGIMATDDNQAEYERKLAEYEAAKESAGHTYVPSDAVWTEDSTSVTFSALVCSNVCSTRQPYLDALLEDDSISVTLENSVTAQAELDSYEGDCTNGAIAVYVASGEAEGYAYTATNKVELEPGTHAYVGDFTWTEVEDEDGNPTGEYTATANVTCGICGDHHEDLEAVVTLDEEKSTAPSCTVDGTNVYVATVTVMDDEGNEIGSASEIKEVPVEKLGHDYDENGICKVCGAGSIRRIYGEDRFETAMAVADELKEELGVETFTTILVANGGDFPDALAGSYLAMQKDAPILLTENKADSKINGNILDYIEKNLSSDGMVYILGGIGSVPEAFADNLEEAGIAFQRLSGANRYETGLKILEETGLNGNEILVCSGEGFADALSISAVNKPILLVNGELEDLSNAQKEYLDALEGDYTFYIIGGTGTVSVELEEVFKTYGTVERVAGADRHATSVAVAEKFYANADCATLAYSMNFPDGLCGGPLAYRLGAPLLLVSTNNEAGAAEYVKEHNIEKGLVFGGSANVTDNSVRTIFGLAEDAEISRIKS